MARVRDIAAGELPADLARIYEDFAGSYGPFRNQAAVFAHVPAALRHLMPLLMELRAAQTLPKRYLELAIVAVSPWLLGVSGVLAVGGVLLTLNGYLLLVPLGHG